MIPMLHRVEFLLLPPFNLLSQLSLSVRTGEEFEECESVEESSSVNGRSLGVIVTFRDSECEAADGGDGNSDWVIGVGVVCSVVGVFIIGGLILAIGLTILFLRRRRERRLLSNALSGMPD
jgi:hypothetical protein